MKHTYSQGRLISMALRCDHAFMLYSDKRKKAILDEMQAYWDEFVATDFAEPSYNRGKEAPSDKWRAWQEATGFESFWTPENDQSYVDSFERNKGQMHINHMKAIYGDNY